MKITKMVRFVFLFFISSFSFAQNMVIDTLKVKENQQLKFNYKQLIISCVFVTYGIIGLESGQIKGFNSGISTEVTEHIDERISIDDFSQYVSIASLYGLAALGIKSKNRTKDKTIIATTSYILMGLTVNAFKKTASVERPESTSFNSFPSGHTATAFMGAELLFKNIKMFRFGWEFQGMPLQLEQDCFECTTIDIG